MYAIELLTDLRWAVCALASTMEAGENWGMKQLRPSGPAEKFHVRPADETDIDALERELFVPADDGIYLWWEDAIRREIW